MNRLTYAYLLSLLAGILAGLWLGLFPPAWLQPKQDYSKSSYVPCLVTQTKKVTHEQAHNPVP